MKATFLPVLGWREWVAFPDLGLGRMKAKVDTGARSSSLHAERVTFFQEAGADWIEFVVHPDQYSTENEVLVKAPLLEKRFVRSSNGVQELRPVVRSTVLIAQDAWSIDLTLTSRASMGFRVLLGREALKRRYMVHPGRSFIRSQRRHMDGTQ